MGRRARTCNEPTIWEIPDDCWSLIEPILEVHYPPDTFPGVWQKLAELGDTGRVLLRPSGTEQLVRVMVEAPSHALAESAAKRLADVVSSAS